MDSGCPSGPDKDQPHNNGGKPAAGRDDDARQPGILVRHQDRSVEGKPDDGRETRCQVYEAERKNDEKGETLALVGVLLTPGYQVIIFSEGIATSRHELLLAPVAVALGSTVVYGWRYRPEVV